MEVLEVMARNGIHGEMSLMEVLEVITKAPFEFKVKHKDVYGYVEALCDVGESTIVGARTILTIDFPYVPMAGKMRMILQYENNRLECAEVRYTDRMHFCP